MEDNRHSYNDGYYEDSEKKRNPLITVIKWILIIIILLIIILLLLRKCGKKPNYEDLLTAGKKYFTQENGQMPTSKGECNTVTLEQLQNTGLIGSNYKSCDKNATYVKVCILPSGSRQYTPVLSCENDKTSFEDYKEGYESNLTKDVSEYYFHGVSHHIGLDTHDVSLGRDVPLEAGNIISNEPGLYISDEGIGIRIEDDLLITEDGCINLASDIIKTVEDMQNFVNVYKNDRAALNLLAAAVRTLPSDTALLLCSVIPEDLREKNIDLLERFKENFADSIRAAAMRRAESGFSIGELTKSRMADFDRMFDERCRLKPDYNGAESASIAPGSSSNV